MGVSVVNSQDMYIWTKDLRVAAAFLARKVVGYIESRFGEFEPEDVGSVIEFDDGSRETIISYINEHVVTYDYGAYYGENTDWMAAAIGNGAVYRVTQTNDMVIRTHGHTFSADDIRKPIFWPDGGQSYIRQYIGPNQVRVWDSTDRNLTGCTTDPISRNFNDILSDEKLFSRSSAWTCKNRFMKPLPKGNMVSIQPGFVLSATRGGNRVYFCQTESAYRPFVGYDVNEYQKVDVDDQILEMVGFPLKYSLFGLSSIYTGVTNNAQIMTIPETQQIISLPSGVDKKASFGVALGSVQRVSDDWVKFITNDNDVLTFNGEVFGPNEAANDETGQGKILKALQSAFPQFTTLYSAINGFVVWWKGK